MRKLSLVVSLVALTSACGGRVLDEGAFAPDALDDAALHDGVVFDDGVFDDGVFDDGVFDDGVFDDGAIVDDTSFPDDVSVPDDGWIPPDSGSFDTSLPPDGSGLDTGIVDTAVPPDTAIDTGPFVDTGVVDTGVVDTGTDAGPPIGTVCNTIADATCTPSFQKCCAASGFGWDYLGCHDIAGNWCDSARDGVAAGKTVYDASYADACANAWKVSTAACTPSIVDWLSTYVPCSQTFNGKTAPGGACAQSSDCHAGPGQTALCDDATKRCRVYQIVGKGSSCSLFGSTIRLCAKGLYCDYTGTPTCKTAKALGATCANPDDMSCGLGNTCKAYVCAVGAPEGASCKRDLECGSWSCSGGTCTSPNVELASKFLCGGG